MRRRTIYFIIFIAIALYLGACGNSRDGYGGPKLPAQAQTAGQESIGDCVEQEGTAHENPEQESTEQKGMRQVQKRSEFVSALSERLSVGDSPEEKIAFAEWLLDTYGLEQMEAINFSEDLRRQIYNATGKSLHVLWDTSLGYLEDENVARAHSVHLRNTEDSVVNLVFAGDICLTEDGYVIDHYDAVGGDINLCLSEEIMDRLNGADISMINHEYPVSTRGMPLKGKYYTFRANPDREMILQQMGIDLVSLANNHIYDFGDDAFYDTLEALKQANIPYVGAGADLEEASRAVYFVAGGIKIGFVSANRSERIIYTPEAGEDTPGVVRMYDTEMMNDIIRQAAEQCDYLIAYVHWGTEDSKYYESYQTDIAQEFFGSGADAIIGSHPHVLQGMGFVDGKPVVYSLGDFWFNGETKYTTIVNLEVTIDGLEELSVLPCIQEGYETHYISDEAGQRAFYDYLRELSPQAVVGDNGVIMTR